MVLEKILFVDESGVWWLCSTCQHKKQHLDLTGTRLWEKPERAKV